MEKNEIAFDTLIEYLRQHVNPSAVIYPSINFFD
jgi:hypothetical protein